MFHHHPENMQYSSRPRRETHTVPTPTTALDDHLSPTEAARILGISRDYLRDLASSGTVPVTAAPGGRRFYPRAAVEELRRVRSERPANRPGRPTIGERAERPRKSKARRRRAG